MFVFCSDGLSGMIEDDVILKIVAETPDLEQAVAGLVDAANQAGGADNVTVLALQCLRARWARICSQAVDRVSDSAKRRLIFDFLEVALGGGLELDAVRRLCHR